MLFIKQRNSYVVFLVICSSWSLIGVRVIGLLAEKLFLVVLLLKGMHTYTHTERKLLAIWIKK